MENKPYIDKTGTADKINPLRDVFLEMPYAMLAVASITSFGAKKHAPRGWQTLERQYALDYHSSKIGRHQIKGELQGQVNPEDGDNLHMAAVAWNALCWLNHYIQDCIEGENFEGLGCLREEFEKLELIEPTLKMEIREAFDGEVTPTAVKVERMKEEVDLRTRYTGGAFALGFGIKDDDEDELEFLDEEDDVNPPEFVKKSRKKTLKKPHVRVDDDDEDLINAK